MRVLVTGSRSWIWPTPLHEALDEHYGRAVAAGGSLVVVHGACGNGADRLAAGWADRAESRGWPVTQEIHKADWSGPYSRGAGMRRNAHMVALGADACLAFIFRESRGATHCAGLAEKAGIPTRYYRQEG
jgi:hypothetical protein